MEQTRSDRIMRFSKMHIDARLAACRSQEYMAMELGVSKKTIQNWEKGLSSPSFFQSLEWFRVLNANPFPYYMSIIYPEKLDGLKGSDDDVKIEEAFNALIHNISINDKRALLYLYYGKHGGSPHSLLQMLLAHLHTPITTRLANAYLVAQMYDLHRKTGNIVNPDNIQPDMKDLYKSIQKAQEAVVNHESGYTNIDIEES